MPNIIVNTTVLVISLFNGYLSDYVKTNLLNYDEAFN